MPVKPTKVQGSWIRTWWCRSSGCAPDDVLDERTNKVEWSIIELDYDLRINLKVILYLPCPCCCMGIRAISSFPNNMVKSPAVTHSNYVPLFSRNFSNPDPLHLYGRECFSQFILSLYWYFKCLSETQALAKGKPISFLSPRIRDWLAPKSIHRVGMKLVSIGVRHIYFKSNRWTPKYTIYSIVWNGKGSISQNRSNFSSTRDPSLIKGRRGRIQSVWTHKGLCNRMMGLQMDIMLLHIYLRLRGNL